MGARIFHLTDPTAWAAAQAAGRLEPAAFAVEGFVHCSTPAQITSTIQHHFVGIDELVLVELDPTSLGGDLRWEESRPGEIYPHLYRVIELADVRSTIAWHRDDDGSVHLPAAL